MKNLIKIILSVFIVSNFILWNLGPRHIKVTESNEGKNNLSYSNAKKLAKDPDNFERKYNYKYYTFHIYNEIEYSVEKSWIPFIYINKKEISRYSLIYKNNL